MRPTNMKWSAPAPMRIVVEVDHSNGDALVVRYHATGFKVLHRAATRSE